MDPSALATTEDRFLGGALVVEQPQKGYRAGVDAVLLAASIADTPAAARVLDLGAGVGTAGLCVARRLAAVKVMLVERDSLLADLAARNIARNRLDARVRAVVADVTDAEAMALGGVAAAAFDHVIANPPYHTDTRGTPAATALKAAAHAMGEGALERWVRAMARHVRAGGTATLVHRADALPALLAALEDRFGGIEVLPVHPRVGTPAIRVLVRGVRGSRAPLSLHAGLVLHGDGGAFTAAATGILAGGDPLPFAGRFA